MVERPEWMSHADVRILETFESVGNMNPTAVMDFSGYSRTHVQNRIQWLVAAGLLRKIHESGLYGLTDRGVDWLRGEISREELPTRSQIEGMIGDGS